MTEEKINSEEEIRKIVREELGVILRMVRPTIGNDTGRQIIDELTKVLGDRAMRLASPPAKRSRL